MVLHTSRVRWFGHVECSTGWIAEEWKTNYSCTEDPVGLRKHEMECWWMTERSFEWILLTLRTVLSGEDDFVEDLSTKTNPQYRKTCFKIDMMKMHLFN